MTGKKYKPVLECANCLRKTEDCTCSSKLQSVVESCGNCGEPLYEDWSFCPMCGFEIKE